MVLCEHFGQIIRRYEPERHAYVTEGRSGIFSALGRKPARDLFFAQQAFAPEKFTDRRECRSLRLWRGPSVDLAHDCAATFVKDSVVKQDGSSCLTRSSEAPLERLQ